MNHEYFRCVNYVLLKLKLAKDTFGLVAKEIGIIYKSQLIFSNHAPLRCKLPLSDRFSYLSLKIVFMCNHCWVIFNCLLFYNSAFGSFDQNLFEQDLLLIYTFPSDSFPPLDVFIMNIFYPFVHAYLHSAFDVFVIMYHLTLMQAFCQP